MLSLVSIAFEKTILLRSLRVSFLVGSLLMLINHGELIFAGAMESKHWLKVLLTFLVPYFVSTYSSVASCRCT
jgi:hypothetical protein